MSVTCTECSIRYAAELPACPWCGHVSDAAAVSAAPGSVPASEAPAHEAPTHTEARSVPPPPPLPSGARPTQSGSVTYNLGEIPGPDEEWDPVDEWLADTPGAPPKYAESQESLAQRLKRWAVLGAAALALLAFGAFLAEVIPVGIGGSGNGSDPTTATPTPTVAVTTIPVPVTTLPPATTVAPPATTVPVPTIPFLEPVGSALAADDLTIAEAGLGELTFGGDGTEALGRLVATFGQPDSDSGARPTPATEDGGFCEGDQQRVVTWGSLSAYNSVSDDGSQTFTSVHLDLANATDPDPAAAAATLSGLQIGDTMTDLRQIYDGFRIEEPGGGVWEIRSGSDGRILLWGASNDGGNITSIRSSRRCTG